MVGYRCLEPSSAEAWPLHRLGARSAPWVAVALTHPICCGSHVLDISSFERELRAGRDSSLFVLGERECCQLSAFLQQRKLMVPLPGCGILDTQSQVDAFGKAIPVPWAFVAGWYDLLVCSTQNTASLC